MKEGLGNNGIKKKKVGNYIYNPAEWLGQGQYGKVYRGQHKDKNIKEHAAVKVIDKNQILDDEYTKNAIVREIEIMKNLKSPNIIQFLEVHQTKNNIYIIQELADQGTLKDVMVQHPYGFTQEAALPYISQLINGFAELSSNGIIHRDIKPTNILIKDNTVKLADFGFSRYTDKMSYMKSIVGTPAYMAPQVINRQVYEKYSYKCDIWSFGVVCYELVVGRLPWNIKTNNLSDLYHYIKDMALAGIEFPSQCKVGEEMKHLIRGCLQFQQKNRLDWTDIFRHPVFKGKFTIKNGIDSQQFIEEAFALTRLRMSVHSQNLNLHKMMKKMPDLIENQDFFVIMKVMDSQISQQQSNCIFRAISENKSNEISRTEFLKYLQKRKIIVSGLKLPKLGGSIEMTNTLKVVEQLANIIESKQIEVEALFMKFDNGENNRMNKQDFGAMLKQVNPEIRDDDIPQIFAEFDTDMNGVISLSECCAKLCKINQVAYVQDCGLKESIKRIQAKKN